MLSLLASLALADPCGMVPPIWIPDGDQPAIQRQGIQQTYVFHHDGIETIAIRPGFSGSVDEFGMLVPLPSAPAIRKIADETFPHLEAAVDPPVVTVHIYEYLPMPSASRGAVDEMKSAEDDGGGGLRFNEVRVLNQEAVGMYEVAVLEAGSDKALARWMTQHDYRYPDGMDAVVSDYVKSGWVFVAVKAKVGQMPGVEPRPGMREATPELPAGASFDGHVQGMAFRFESEHPVVPMRLSTFNGDDLHNRVYMLTDQPVRIEGVSQELVRRQVDGKKLYTNVAGKLEVVWDGDPEQVPAGYRQQIESQRDPTPYNGVAKALFASDLLAARRGELALPFETREKELLNISEALSLRGPEVDRLHSEQIASLLTEATGGSLPMVQGLTLTVIDGDFPRALLRDQNLRFAGYRMPAQQNRKEVWTQQPAGPEIWVPVNGGRGWNPFRR